MYMNLGDFSSNAIDRVVLYSEKGRRDDYITYLNTVEDYVESVSQYEKKVASLEFHSSPYEEEYCTSSKRAEIVMHSEAPMEQKYYRSLKDVYTR